MLHAVYDEPSVITRGIYKLHTANPTVQKNVSPCSAACPVGIDIPKVQFHVGQGQFLKAFETVMMENPFPSTCGRICFHSCETACHRSAQDDAVAIRCIERFVGDQALRRNSLPVIKQLPSNGKRIAVLGAGPSGLSAAYFLTLFGFCCDLYESSATPGQSIQWGIPESRLPQKVLSAEINRIRSMGVTIRCGQPLTPHFVRELVTCCDAVVVGSGISQSITFSQSVYRDHTSLLGALQTGEDTTYIELGNLTIELGTIPVVYGGGWYNGIQSIAHAVGSGKTAAIALYAYFDTGRDAIRESVEISRVGNGTAQSMEIYLLGERSHASCRIVRENEIDRTVFPPAARIEPHRSVNEGGESSLEMVEQTLDAPSALYEAIRCYGCGYHHSHGNTVDH